jgi:hypothetical protein
MFILVISFTEIIPVVNENSPFHALQQERQLLRISYSGELSLSLERVKITFAKLSCRLVDDLGFGTN